MRENISSSSKGKGKAAIIKRIVELGVPEEQLRYSQLGLVVFAKDNKSLIPELVHAILPNDNEVAEIISEERAETRKIKFSTILREHFQESMDWLQWLMFNGDPKVALKCLSEMSVGQRGVCGAVWGDHDIAYRCRTCEHDPTCAICVPCFQNGNHQGHDYSIIYTGGGCCDCGDVTAWKREGFCSAHKGVEQILPLPEEFAISVGPVLDALLVYWKKMLFSIETVHQANYKSSDGGIDPRKVGNELTLILVEMLLDFCKHSESLLSFISRKVISTSHLLNIMVKTERFLGEVVLRRIHELLLKLLGEPIFKYEFAKVFLAYYPTIIDEAIKECADRVFKKSPLLSTFSVQIFTVPTLTPRLVKEDNLLAMLLGCLWEIFISCAGEDRCFQVNKWINLYETTVRVVEDIRFVMSHVEISKFVICQHQDILRTWMELLAFVQGMSSLKREVGIHVEEEHENMNYSFSLSHSIANVHLQLVNGVLPVSNSEEVAPLGDEDGLRQAKVGRLSLERSVCGSTGKNTNMVCTSKVAEINPSKIFEPQISSPVIWLISECLKAIDNWLRVNDTDFLVKMLTPNRGGSDNFLELKGTPSKIKVGKYISSEGTSSSNIPEGQFSSSLHASIHASDGANISIGHCTGRVQHTLTRSEVGGEDILNRAVLDDAAMGRKCAAELDALQVLSMSEWPDIIYDVSSQDISVHIPLHRLLSLILQKTIQQCYDGSAMLDASFGCLLSKVHCNFFEYVLGGCHPYGFSAFIMEHPLRIRVFCAQVRAGMWRKNGDTAILACDLYSSVRWYEQALELDLFLMQCCAALGPSDLYVGRILERFGLSSYLSLNVKWTNEYCPVLVQEMLTLLIQIVKERRFCGLTTAENLKRELVYKLAIADATHSQLVKSLPRDLSKTDQVQEILDRIAVYSNPSDVNQGLYSLKWNYWKELDLYHPRWNPRDLQAAEERYSYFCGASALITQLPKWTKVYDPLSGIAGLATCKAVLQIIHAVFFYAVFSDNRAALHAPDSVLLTALHLLALALDICSVTKQSCEQEGHVEKFIPLLAYAGESIGERVNNGVGEQSLLSLLVSLMWMHKKENLDSFREGNCDISLLIENLLRKFAEIDFECMTKLQKLAPDLVNGISEIIPKSDKDVTLQGDSGKRKAKARERQAAILEKMRTEQSKFLSSMSSIGDDDMSCEKGGQDACDSDVRYEPVESEKYVCSLCRDPDSESPVSFLIFLQKSKLLSFIDKGPPSWDQVCQSSMAQRSVTRHKASHLFIQDSLLENADVISSTQVMQLVQNAKNEFVSHAQAKELCDFLEFVKNQFPAVGDIQLLHESSDPVERAASSLESLEEDIYVQVQRETHKSSLPFEFANNNPRNLFAESGPIENVGEPILLGKYLVALSREGAECPSAVADSRNNKTLVSRLQVQAIDGFGPMDCDGIHISSCGHAVHQECLDRYLLSLKERYMRRLVFEGGHIVDPDKGEFICPVCRRLANSVLPASPGDRQNDGRDPVMQSADLSLAAGTSDTSNKEIKFLRLLQGLTLLQSAANVVGKSEILRTLPMQRRGGIKASLESVFGILCGMYYSGKRDKFSGSPRVNPSLILWDTLKYSLMSTEIVARSGKTSMCPTYGLDSLYKELKASSGFILSLLLKIVQSTQSENSLNVLLRFRGLQLFAGSICSGVSLDKSASNIRRPGDNILKILKIMEEGVEYPDIQFWSRASDPILARDPFSSLMWMLFCLPFPFLSCEESFLSLVHICYVVSISQAIITYYGKFWYNISESAIDDCLITDLFKVMGDPAVVSQNIISNYVDSSLNIKDTIRSLSFPYLRRCALLSKLLNFSVSEPGSNGAHSLNKPYFPVEDMSGAATEKEMELAEVEKVEQMFMIPSLDDILKEQLVRSLVLRWFDHFRVQVGLHHVQYNLHCSPVVPFRLMHLPHVYQDLLERYIKQRCPCCKAVLSEPALCLLCGRLCSPSWKSCCSQSGCQSHAMACGAGTGIFLLVRKSTILLQRSARQALWPSPYLDAYGEEDIEIHRGKPLYLNQERYAALCYMVSSHGLDRSSKVLGQTTIGTFILV